MADQLRIDAHVHLTKGTILLSSKDVPGFVRRLRKPKNGVVDLARLMAEFRAQCEAKLQERDSA